MSNLSELDLNITNIPSGIIEEFTTIAVERGVKQDELAKTAIVSFVEAAGVIPPVADEIVEKLRRAQREFNNFNVIHLSLAGSIARGSAKRGSDIDLVATFKGSMGISKIGGARELAESILGKKHKIDFLPASSLKPHVYESVLKDAINIF